MKTYITQMKQSEQGAQTQTSQADASQDATAGKQASGPAVSRAQQPQAVLRSLPGGKSRVWNVVVGMALQRTSSPAALSSAAPSTAASAPSSLPSLKSTSPGAAVEAGEAAAGEWSTKGRAGGVQGPQSAVCPVLLAYADSHSARIVGMLASAFARARVRDEEVFRRLSDLVSVMDERAFSPLGLSQVLHALAVLNLHDEVLVQRLLEMAQRTPPHLFTAHSVANIAWALAVFDVTDAEVLSWLWGLVERTYRQMAAIHFRQLHQLLLTCEQAHQSPSTDEFPRASALARECLKVYTRSSSANVTSSQLQQHVARTLARLGHDVVEVCCPPSLGPAFRSPLMLTGSSALVSGAVSTDARGVRRE